MLLRCRLCQLPRGHKDTAPEIAAAAEAAAAASEDAAAARAAVESVAGAAADAAASAAAAAAAGRSSVRAAHAEAATAANAAAAAVAVAAAAHREAARAAAATAAATVQASSHSHSDSDGSSGEIGGERPSIFAEAAEARRVHVQGVKAHERLRAAALAAALAATRLSWLAMGALLDDGVLADQQVCCIRARQPTGVPC